MLAIGRDREWDGAPAPRWPECRVVDGEEGFVTGHRAHRRAAVPRAVASIGLALALGVALQVGLGAGPAAGAQPAPRMPKPAGIGKPEGGVITPIGVPAAAATSTGVYTIYSGWNRPVSRTTIRLPAASGIPLMGDWNGDGLATPGIYQNGSWRITNAAAGTRQWENLTRFGGATDTPVVGYLDGDRRVDVGTFNNGTWNWQLSSQSNRTREQFGEPGDRPVVGDWDGDGKDDLGVFRNGSWILRIFGVDEPPKVSKDVTVTMIPEAKAALLTFAWGQPTDVPIAGDWDGDGTDTPGLVRNGSQWLLSKSIRKPGKSVTLDVALAADQVPLVGTQATGRGHCPTATPGSERAAARLARKVRPPARLTGNPQAPGQADVRALVQDSLRYVMTFDYTNRLKDEWVTPYFDAVNLSTSLEEALRRSGNAAMASAIMLQTSGWQDVNGISRAQLKAYALWQLRSLACQHAANTPGGWGLQWQSALWAATVAQAGWLMWDDLQPIERGYVAAMIAAEADAVADRGPHYYRNREGVELAPGNSKADEVSWDVTAPALAWAMLPRSSHAERWRKAVVEYAIAAFARPSDLSNNIVVNGVNISKALPGTNANEDGTITNHGIVNPDYTQNVLHLWWAASMLRSARVPVPEALFLNADIVYRALSVVKFPSPPYAAPGGVSYQADGRIYYPMGAKGGNRRPAAFTGVDAFAVQYSAPDTRAATHLAAHARDARAMQNRFSDGRIYDRGRAEEAYALGREEYALGQMALAWWAGAQPSGPGMKLDRGPVPGINLSPRGADR